MTPATELIALYLLFLAGMGLGAYSMYLLHADGIWRIRSRTDDAPEGTAPLTPKDLG